jgi:hypothetical protein
MPSCLCALYLLQSIHKQHSRTAKVEKNKSKEGSPKGQKVKNMYDYREIMAQDIKDFLEENFELMYADVDSIEELQERLQDDLFTEDSITGNASGSYTFSRAEAKEYVLDNMDECIEALKEFCVDAETIAEKFLSEDWEYFDVTIRCYLLGEVLANVMDDIEEGFEAWLAGRDE